LSKLYNYTTKFDRQIANSRTKAAHHYNNEKHNIIMLIIEFLCIIIKQLTDKNNGQPITAIVMKSVLRHTGTLHSYRVPPATAIYLAKNWLHQQS